MEIRFSYYFSSRLQTDATYYFYKYLNDHNTYRRDFCSGKRKESTHSDQLQNRVARMTESM